MYKREDVYNATLQYFKGDTLATDVWINKYSLKDTIDGRVDDNTVYYELTPDDMHKRIARELHRIEKKYSNPLSEEKIFDLIKNFKYMVPQGSPMSGIGNDRQTVSLSNCFVIGNDADSYGGIFLTDQEQAQLMKRRGGVGHDLSHIRPKGMRVKNSALTSTGIVPFMERFSNTTEEVAQDGRRGALMLTVSVKHPDSGGFIDAKMQEGKITGANVSIKIHDDFMKAVSKNTKYTQSFPIDSKNPKFTKDVEAKPIWDKIVHNAWKSAEPGILFWDTIMRESVPDCYQEYGFKTISTNPCVVGDSLIAVADGRNAVSIKQLALEGEDVPVYSTNNEGKVEIKWGRNPRKTKKNVEVWKLTLDDGSELIATPDHRIYMKNNTYKELKDLIEGDSISSFYSFSSNKGYRQIAQTGQKMLGGRFRNRRQYRLIHEFYYDEFVDYKNVAIHHKDFDNSNDKTFADFKNQVVNNHKVMKIEFYGYEDVYNITVDDNHNYNIITNFEDDKYITSGGICVKNCGEITLCPYDSCRLLAINLYSYVVNPFTKDAYFDFELFSEHVQYAQRFMDDIIDLELEKIDKILEKIITDPEPAHIKRTETELWLKIKEMSEKGRRTGLGVTAEGDMIAALNLRYGTKPATEFSTKVHKILAINAYKSSAIMAEERGSFPVYDYEKEINNPFISRLKNDDPELNEKLKKGRRNIALLTIAPTGSVSICTQTTSGIEPVYLVSYKRRRKINPNDKDSRSDFIDDKGVHWEEYNVFHHKFETWLEINGYNIGEVKKMKEDELKEIIKKSPYYKATSNDVDWVEKVRMQGEVQKYVDHSISVTVNLPNDVTEEMVSKVYETGWKSGCKGITVYRDGSRQGVIVSHDEKSIEQQMKENNAKRRPKRLECEIIKFTNNKEKWVAFLGIDEISKEKYPYELFTGLAESFQIPIYVEHGTIIKIKEKDSDGVIHKRYDFEYTDRDGYKVTMQGLNRAFNREFWNYSKMVSAFLRHRIHLPSVLNIVDGMNMATNGEEELNFGTWKAGVKRILKKWIKDSVETTGTICPECGSTNIIWQNGCKECQDCGFQGCD